MCVIGRRQEHDEAVVSNKVAPKARNVAEEAYLAKLQAIRRQNYIEKKRIQEKVHGAGKMIDITTSPTPPQLSHHQRDNELEARRKKIAALKVLCVYYIQCVIMVVYTGTG